jgi:hypothetical protein
MVAVPNVIERMWWKLAGICGIGVFSLIFRQKKTTMAELDHLR